MIILRVFENYKFWNEFTVYETSSVQLHPVFSLSPLSSMSSDAGLGESRRIGVRGWVIVIRAITITSYITFILGVYIVICIRLFKIENLYIVQIASHLPLGVTEGRARKSFKKG